MIPRTLEPEAMDTVQEARDYDSMDHSWVNRQFVDDFFAVVESGTMKSGLSGGAVVLEVLDCGTGTALIPIELCQRRFRCRVTAIDIASEMLKVASKNIVEKGLEESVHLEQADAKRLPYQSGAFATVISNSIVHHIPKPRDVLAEMTRVLKPGGVLFVRDLMRPDDVKTVDRLVTTYAGKANDHQQQMFRDSLLAALRLDEVRELLAEVGLPGEWATRTSDRHWTIAGVMG